MSTFSELAPCNHEKAFRKTITTNDGTVFVCEVCSHHWYRTWAQINSAVETKVPLPSGCNPPGLYETHTIGGSSPPYPWCRQPSVCRGTCPLDPNCGE